MANFRLDKCVFWDQSHLFELLPSHPIMVLIVHQKQSFEHFSSIGLTLLPMLTFSLLIQREKFFTRQSLIFVGIVLRENVKKLLLKLVYL